MLPARAIEVDAGVAPPVAFGGPRKILRARGEMGDPLHQQAIAADLGLHR